MNIPYPTQPKHLCKQFTILFLLLGFSIFAKADEFEPSISGTGIDEYGSFIDFKLTTSNTDGINRWINSGSVWVQEADGSGGVAIATFSSNSAEGHLANFALQSGVAARVRGSSQGWSGMFTDYGNKVFSDPGGAQTIIYFRWYMPQSYFGRPHHFSVFLTVDGNSSASGTGARGYPFDLGTIQNPLINATLSAGISANAGNMKVDYSYTGTIGGDAFGPPDYTISHWLGSTTANTKTDATNKNASGFIDLARSNNFANVVFHSKFAGKGGYVIYSKDQTISMPAYQWPTGITPAYNESTGVLKVSWLVDKLADNTYIKGDEFEIQRSLDAAFPSAGTKTFTVAFDGGALNNNKFNYSINDDLTSENVQGTVYYRLRRTKSKTDWEWKTNIPTSLKVNMKVLSVAAIPTSPIALDQSGATPKIILKWNVINGVWPAGSRFIIHRKETGNNNSTSSTDISLTDVELRKGIYADENINTCVNYSYRLLVQPGGNVYAALAEVPLPGTAILGNLGSISDLQVSKGYYSDRVELQWHSQGGFTQYLVYRTSTGNFANAVQIATVPATSTAGTNILYEDTRPVAGTYYTYFVEGVSECGNTVSKTPQLKDIGFRSPTGNIYGRVTYENGQAVEDVGVRLQNNSGTLPAKSINLSGKPESYLQIDSLSTPFSEDAFSIEAWIKPADNTPVNQVVFSKGGQYEIGFDPSGNLYFSSYGNTVTGQYTNPNKTFVHIAGVYQHDSLLLYLNGEKIGSNIVSTSPSGSISNIVLIGKSQNGYNYAGNIDEMRAWNKALTTSEISKNYTRMMVGYEEGMIAYWRFDETIADQFFDLSQKGDVFNRNDGYMDPAFVTRSTIIPTADQLALKDFSDASGNYMISGIPYTDNGINYTVIPTLGTHQFNPISVNRLISSSSNQFTVDFKDKSSFPVSGTIYYRNSTIPVKGVQFQIDGLYAHQSNGDIIETDAAGKFTISVPVGTHEVKALKLNHVFENGGLITDRFGRNLNYQGPIAERILNDTTTIRFIGRVAGGSVQEGLALGHSLSKNNLGEKLSVTMELVGAQNRMINATSADSLITVNHLLPTNQQATQRKTKVDFKTYSIVIQPDSITGEFVADLIPENYNITSVKATGHEDLIGNNPVNINLSDKFNKEKETYTYKDSVTADGGSFVREYTDTVYYNDKYKFTYREKPAIAVKQLNGSGEPVEYFGDTTIQTTTFSGASISPQVYSNATKSYLFGYPVFSQNVQYGFSVTAFEQYNYFTESNLLTPASIQKVATTDGQVSIANSLRDGANAPDTFSLNDKGEAVYAFYAGTPEMSNGIGRKGFSLSIKIGSQVIQWNNGATQEVYILGGRKTGTDFVTGGPNEILTVLRDPQGSNSQAYYLAGTTLTTTKEYTGTAVQSGSIEMQSYLGTSITTSQGIGFTITTKQDFQNTFGGRISHEESYTGTNTKTAVTTLLSQYTTSSDPAYVGADGDLFIGNSTNISFGNTLNLAVVPNIEVKAGSDVIFFNGNTNGIPYSIIQRSGIDFAQQYGTFFVYPAKHIENVLIPNLVKGRNDILLPNTTSGTTAQSRADNIGQVVYVSKLPASDSKYGASNEDVSIFGAAATKGLYDGPSYKMYIPSSGNISISDTIQIINQHISKWKQELSDNEKAKLEAKTILKNYSFTGGSNIDVSEQTTTSSTKANSFEITVGGSILSDRGIEFNGAGFSVTVDESLSTIQGGNFSSGSTSTKTLGFTLAENGSDYLSIDVLKAADSSFVFRTKGGVTKCPYEGATVAKYYQPGSVIDQPTMQAEVPAITVEQPVVSNIPSSRKASYTIKLFNASDIKNGASFKIHVGDQSNPNGAKVYMDGTELGTGREISVPSGDALTKTITLERGPSAMDYENIQIILESTCQSDIADTVLISAHFIPSCSDIHIKSPVDKWVLNTASPVNNKGDYYLPVTIDQFDVNNTLFDHIELQYKPTSSAIWITVMKFFSDTARYNAAQGEKMKITQNGIINYSFAMDAAALSDQNYDVRAVSVCMDNGQVIATTESNLVSGIKDTYNPRLFGNPQPANGILGIEDDVRINFNEAIAEGLLSYSDFQVTGIRNGTITDHTVAVKLDGQNDYIATEFSKNLAAKNITVETWALANGAANGTLFSQGAGAETIELSMTSGNYLEVTVGSKVIKSNSPVAYKQGEWAHVAMVLNATTNKVSAYYNFQPVIIDASVNAYSGTGTIQIGRSIQKNGNLFAGKLHELRIWSNVLTAVTLQQNSLKRLSGEESGLLTYYPMTEGKGNIVFDKARGVNAKLTGNWSLPPGKAVALVDGNAYVKLNTSFAPVQKDMDYTLELWFKGKPGQANASLLSNGRGDGNDFGGSDDLFFLGFENGVLVFQNNGVKVSASGSYLDNNWHHVAVAVNRNAGNGQLLVDGLLNKTFDTQNLGGIASAFTYVGARGWYGNTGSLTLNVDNYFNGNIDEIRIWNTYLSQSILAQNNNVGLKGDEFGLMAYYPFNKYYLFQNNQEMGYTLSDMKIQDVATVVVPDATVQKATESDETAPVKSRGPVENLQFSYVVNSDALIINLLETRQAIDKTIVTFKAKNIRDKNGNTILSPITWSAYIDRNPLKWSDDELNFSKDVYAPLQFEAQIVNHGGSMQNFRLQNLPGWLTASPSSGTLNPKGTQKIVFTVNKGLNVGAYDEIVYMLNDNQESEPLAINLTVKGPKPDWKVDPASFKNNMTVYGRIRTLGVFSNNGEDMLGAFANGKCVGVTNNQYFTVNDNWYTLLTVYSDSIRQSNIEFRIWEAATGKTYLAVPSQAVSFVNDTIFGSPRNPVIFDGSEMQFQNTPLNNGWNWISFGLTSSALNSVPATLANGNWASGDIVKNEELGFDQYASASGWVGYLPKFNNTSLFMLKTGNAQTLSISGTKTAIANTHIPVKGGRWNYISYLPQVNVSVKEALADYQASDEDVIKSQTGFAMYDSRNGWIGNLTYLEPGKGYMLYRKATSDTSFVYPTITGILTNIGARLTGEAVSPNSMQSPVSNNYAYAENMTMIAVVEKDFDLLPGDKVFAYAGGELRGEASTIDNPVTHQRTLFFNISGNAAQFIHFTVERNGSVVGSANETFNYLSNSNLGTLHNPYVIKFGKEAIETGAVIYPNPFHEKVNIRLNLNTEQSAAGNILQMNVYDLSGKLIYSGASMMTISDYYELSWNGKNNSGGKCAPGVYMISVTVNGKLKIYKVSKI